MSLFWIKKPDVVTEREDHVVIVHSKCEQTLKDFYMADLILALLRSEKKVTLCTTETNKQSPIMNVENVHHNLYFISTWKYLPQSLFGCLSKSFLQLKMLWLIFRIILWPQSNRPSLIISDVNSSVISLLKRMTSLQVVYVKHFSDLRSGDHFYPPSDVPISFGSSMTRADEIIVPTECLKSMLETCLPPFTRTLSVLNPCYDTGLWMNEPLDLASIVPSLPLQNFLFVVFGEFKSRTNLQVVLQAMDFIVRFMEITFSVKVHLVVAGFSEVPTVKEDRYFETLVNTTTTKLYANNVTFLKRTTIPQQKTLIANCTAVLNPTNDNVFPGSILMAMNMKKPIISVDNGFAKQVLENNVTGYLVHDFPSMFATKMEELAKVPQAGVEICENAKREFDENYGFQAYSRKVNEIVDRYLNY